MKTSVFVSDCLFWLFFVIYYSCFQHTVHILIFLQSLHDEENSVVISLWFGVELPLLMALLQYLIQQGKINGKWNPLLVESHQRGQEQAKYDHISISFSYYFDSSRSRFSTWLPSKFQASADEIKVANFCHEETL